ncbi:MAG: GerW family sporulation protein, partial [Eubacteriales bacterium]
MSHPLPDMMATAMEKIRSMTDSSTIIGDPIVIPDGVTIIPVSKVSYGFGGGGSDYATKNQVAASKSSFGGGLGVGVTITPVSFMVVKGDSVRMLAIPQPATNTADRVLEMIP